MSKPTRVILAGGGGAEESRRLCGQTWPNIQLGKWLRGLAALPADQNSSIEKFVHKYTQPVLAISERSGVVVESGRLYSVGFEMSYRFDIEGKSEV
jgi:hypothetical protein